MANPAPRPMTVAEFLDWEDGSELRYELIDGRPVGMAPPSEAHGTIVANLAGELRARVRPPCRVVVEAGIVLPERDDTWYQADLAVTCAPAEPGARRPPEPRLIVEVVSPSTVVHDRGRKLPDYRTLPSVHDVLLVAADERRVEHWRREGERWVGQELIGEASVQLTLGGAPLPLSAIYAEVALGRPAAASS